MKKLIYFIIAISLIGCSTEKNKDEKAGATMDITSSGLDYASAKLLLNDDSTAYESNSIKYAERLKLVLSGVKGFNSEGGRIFPGAHMVIIDEKGTIILEQTDLFSDYDSTGIEESKVDLLYVQMIALAPLEIGKEYSWETRFWDKRGNGEIIAKIPVKVTGPNEVEVKIKKDKIEFWRAYLAGEKGIKSKAEFSPGDLMYIEIEQVKGLLFEEDSNHMSFESVILNADGPPASETIYDTLKLKNISILEGYMHLSEKMTAGNYKWVSKFTDLVGKGYVEATVNIKVVK